MTFNSDHDLNKFWYFLNTTHYTVAPEYRNSVVQCFDAFTSTLYINYINPKTGIRSLLVTQPTIPPQPSDDDTTATVAENGQFREYKFTIDATTSVNSKVYLIFTSIDNPASTPLFMIEVTNSTGGPSKINLIAITISNSTMEATSKLILSLDNTGGSDIDGIPVSFIDQRDYFLVLLSKKVKSTYTITSFDLLTFATQSVDTKYFDYYNNGLFHSYY